VHQVGREGVVSITATGDGKVEFIAYSDHALAFVRSAMGYPAYYPVHPVTVARPVQAVLMDLDGTSVRSEHFWIWMIERTLATLLDRPGFAFTAADLPHVSGHSVSEHLQYGLSKYCPDHTVEEARAIYFQHTRRELAEIVAGRGRADAFTPSPGLKAFLLALKRRGLKIGLVTSGLYEKAWPEILAAFRALELGDPLEFYDAIVTAGFHPGIGQAGTLGELSLKPHPWLYAEAARVGMGIPFEQRGTVVGIEDSGAGICALRLAGFAAIGLAGGNIVASGTRALCCTYGASLDEVLEYMG
jgi:beta-phosphoglucomutase-like phosphatase (HAD superfamily)